MRGDGGVAGEGRVVGVPKFHSWSTFIMPLTNINSDWMSNGSLLKLLVKELLHNGKVPVNAELRPLRRETNGSSAIRHFEGGNDVME